MIQGNGAYPETLNRYGYCWGNPVSYVDRDGKIGYYFYDPDTFETERTRNMVEADVALLKEYYKTDIKVIKMDTEGDPNSDSEMIENYTFQKAWESMDRTDTIDVVVIFSHASNDSFVANTDTEENQKQRIDRTDIEELAKRNIDTLILLGCNIGLDNKNIQNEDVQVYDYSLAEAFLKGNNADSIHKVIASDGYVCHGYVNGNHVINSKGCIMYHANNLERILYDNETGIKIDLFSGDNLGFRTFENVNGNIYCSNMECKKYFSITSLLSDANVSECPN